MLLNMVSHIGDRVVGRQGGVIDAPVIPADMLGYPDDRLRVDGDVVVDAAGYTTFFVDPDDGYKHIVDGDGRQELACAWDDDLKLAGGTWAVLDPADKLRGELLAYAADKRWRVETGGITVGGVPVATDDRSKIMIIGARVKADADANFTTEWKTPSGFVTIDAATIVAISNAVLAHVDACFAVEAAVLADIEAGDITSTIEIDAADWPA